GGRKVERAARGRGASGRSGGAGRGRPGCDRRGSWLKIGLLGLLAGVLSVSGLLVWSLLPGSAGEEGGGSVVIWLDGSDKGQAVERLAEAGLVQSPPADAPVLERSPAGGRARRRRAPPSPRA